LELENAILDWLGRLILQAKPKHFIGKTMLQESTYGKTILPPCPHSYCFYSIVTGKKWQDYASKHGKTMSKVTSQLVKCWPTSRQREL
jgi:hypothetical protein